MTQVKYRCRVHGKFTVSLDIGGRCRRGGAPTFQACPECGEACPRARAKPPGISLTTPTADALKAYCQRHGMSHGQVVELAIQSDEALLDAAARIRGDRR